MPLDFPQNPTQGQIFLHWVFDGTKWVALASGGWADAPADGNTYGRKNLGWNSVDAMLAPRDNNTGRNLVHNGLFNVAQRGAGPFTTSNVYTLDRWHLEFNLGSASVTSVALTDAARAQIGDEAATNVLANAFTGAGGGGYNLIDHMIEGVRRLAGKVVTVSFYAAVTAGTATRLGASLDQLFGTGGAPSAAVRGAGISVPIAATWARYSMTFTLPSVAGMTLGTNGNDYTMLRLWFSAGNTYATPSGGVGVQSGTIQVWGVQLEIGSVATPLAKRDPEQELALCQRFYTTGSFSLAGYSQSGIANSYVQTLPVTMRATPTMTPNVTTNTNTSGPGLVAPTVTDFRIQTGVAASGGYAYGGTYTASADL